MQELKQPPVSDCSVQYHFTCCQWLDFADKYNQDTLSFSGFFKKNKTKHPFLCNCNIEINIEAFGCDFLSTINKKGHDQKITFYCKTDFTFLPTLHFVSTIH